MSSFIPKVAAPLAMAPYAALQASFLQEVQQAANTAIKVLSPGSSWAPVCASTRGSFPWNWQLGPNFNAQTYNWLNNVFSFNPAGFFESTGQSLNTDLYNLFSAMTYQLSPTDQTAYDKANLAAGLQVNTLLNDFQTTFGALKGATTDAQLVEATAIILSWATTAPLTLAQLRASKMPAKLLGNAPLGSGLVINDLISYLNATSSVTGIQDMIHSYNTQIASVLSNLTNTPASANAGWVSTIDAKGVNSLQPYRTLTPSPVQINNSLYPTAGGNSFHVSLSISNVSGSTNTVQAGGQAGVSVSAGFLAAVDASTSVSFDMCTAAGNSQDIDVVMTYNGVTSVSPVLAASAYNISTDFGWWLPQFLSNAANASPAVSGLQFSVQPVGFNFAQNGNFGVLGELFISQPPIVSLTYKASSMSAFSKAFATSSHFNLSFLGIPIASGSANTYTASFSQNAAAGTITVTMSPPTGGAAPAAIDQMAYVVGASMIWPGA